MQPHAVQRVHPHVRGSQFRLKIPRAAGIFLRVIHGAVGQKEKNSATGRHGDEPSVKRNAKHEATVARYVTQPCLTVSRPPRSTPSPRARAIEWTGLKEEAGALPALHCR